MRPREVGGMEPDDGDQARLVELWHLSRIVSLERPARITQVVNWFLEDHPDAGRKWVYVWCERHLGRLIDPDANPVPVQPWMQTPCQPTRHASLVPAPTRRPRKKRAK